MKRFRQTMLVALILAAGSWGVWLQTIDAPFVSEKTSVFELERGGYWPQARSSFSPKNPEDRNARLEYELRRLRNPETRQIPENMRRRELAFAENLPNREELMAKGGRQIYAADWNPRGPFNVGGRTRALAIDRNFNGTTNQRILAGGVSGGIFLSTDNGASWQLRSDLDDISGVTSIAQDPNQTNVWYAGTGEQLGASAGGAYTTYLGYGIFKSTDNGDSWTPLESTISGNLVSVFDKFFDRIWNVAIHPQGSVVFAATYGRIMRSVNGGASWEELLGESNPPYNTITDVAIAPDGSVYATLSRNGAGMQNYGVFRSTDLGVNWSNVSPPTLAGDPYRMVLGVSQSDANTVYMLAQTTRSGASPADHQLFRFDAANGTWTDLTANIPNFEGRVGPFNSQGGYDLIVSVKPDDPNVIWIGGTNLYRSIDGGQTFTFDGGYFAPDVIGLYENHHPDQHSIAFYPDAPNSMISGHDGGLSFTNNNLENPQTWTSLNNGYLTSQFYAIAIDPLPGSDLIVGGLQDNGSWVTESSVFESPWNDLTGGDGGFSAAAPGGLPVYTSLQNGTVVRIEVDNGQLVGTIVQPSTPNGDDDFNFITPFVLDPNDSRVMYICVSNGVWRNSNLEEIPLGNGDVTSINWTSLSNSAIPGMVATTVAVATTPANRVYFGATDFQFDTKLIRLDNAETNPAGVDITPPGVPGGSVASSVGINPDNGDEILVTFANYGIVNLYHSTDGGASWTTVEGNLGGDDGPSTRWASILPTGFNTMYFVGTSVGLFSTSAINGESTNWTQEGASTIGNVVVDMVVSRKGDGLVAAGTHGRGVYSANVAVGAAQLAVDATELQIEAKPGESGATTFTMSNPGSAPLNFDVTASGNFPSNSIPKLSKSNQKAPHPKKLEAMRRLAERKNSLGFDENDMPNRQTLSSGTDVITLDDGNETPDTFVGVNDNLSFFWLNFFTVAQQDFSLEAVQVYLRTESATTNPVDVAVFDADFNTLVSGTVDLELSTDGQWYTINFNPPLNFSAGASFQIEIGASGDIVFPAGTDQSAAVPNNSFFFDWDAFDYVNLNTQSGFENAAFLIRAMGTLSGGSNEPPVASGTISTLNAQVGETITFDASTSSDPDGQIVTYNWNFGDGNSSALTVATHSYASPGTFDVVLTVTDDDGASSQASGQVSITQADNQPPVASANVSPNPATAGETVTFDGSGSSDPDGQIVTYNWNFGDGNTSNQQVANHAYASTGTFNYSLTVTDDRGGSAQTSGQITVNPAGPQLLTVTPSAGSVPAGGSQEITVTLDASSLAENTYTGQVSITSNGGGQQLGLTMLVRTPVSVDDEEIAPETFALMQNYPNPFNPQTRISYALPERAEIQLTIYNLQGQLVKTLFKGEKAAGAHNVTWNGRDVRDQLVGSGLYIYRLETVTGSNAGTVLSRKMTFVK